MSNCLDPDQDRHSVGPDLGPNFLQRISADDLSPQARKELKSHVLSIFYINLFSTINSKMLSVTKVLPQVNCFNSLHAG